MTDRAPLAHARAEGHDEDASYDVLAETLDVFDEDDCRWEPVHEDPLLVAIHDASGQPMWIPSPIVEQAASKGIDLSESYIADGAVIEPTSAWSLGDTR